MSLTEEQRKLQKRSLGGLVSTERDAKDRNVPMVHARTHHPTTHTSTIANQAANTPLSQIFARRRLVCLVSLAFWFIWFDERKKRDKPDRPPSLLATGLSPERGAFSGGKGYLRRMLTLD